MSEVPWVVKRGGVVCLLCSVLFGLLSGCADGEGGAGGLPTRSPEISPTKTLPAPTRTPTRTDEPTEEPTDEPTEEPSEEPTEEPSESPGAGPTESPTEQPTTPSGGTQAQIRDLLRQAEAKFAAADRAQADGDTVRWARLMEEGRALIEEAVRLAD
jgi:outer membrane biosynthesis protein TonB